MSKQKHTPGPWRIEWLQTRTVISTMTGKEIAEVLRPDLSRTQQAANAELLKAAPDLLQAAKLEQKASKLTRAGSSKKQGKVERLRARAHRKRERAIAKAGGRE